jgi:hypothetical protein
MIKILSPSRADENMQQCHSDSMTKIRLHLTQISEPQRRSRSPPRGLRLLLLLLLLRLRELPLLLLLLLRLRSRRPLLPLSL